MSDKKDTLPVRIYDDVASPSLQLVGSTLSHAVHLSLRPVEGVLWGIDQAFDWVADRVMRRLAASGIRAEDVVTPSVDVEGRVLLGLQTAGPQADALLRNLFAGLLATAMGPSRSFAHPAIAETLRQITPEEARIFSLVSAKRATLVTLSAKAFWVQTKRAGRKPSSSQSSVTDPDRVLSRVWPLLAEEVELNEERVRFLLANLVRNGLVGIDRASSLPKKRASSTTVAGRAIRECTQMLRDFASTPPSGGESNLANWTTSTVIELSGAHLTQWGHVVANTTGAAEFYDLQSRQFCMPGWAG